MSADLVVMRRVIGDEAANATLARNVLAPVESRLSGGGDTSALHRRCVLFECPPTRVRIEDVCAAMAPFGDIEAVALCGYMLAAVVVFRTEAAAASALAAPRQAGGSCRAVPPLELGIDMVSLIGPTHVKVMSDSPIPATGTPAAGGGSTPEPSVAAPQLQTPREELPWIEFRDPSVEGHGPGIAGPRGSTKQFRPSADSLVRGPTRGADGSLWMHGDMITTDKQGIEYVPASIRVRRSNPPPRDRRRGIPDNAIWFEPL
ncbi:hypothetical protein ACP70R_041663 [Stipagrostis hirtigluma subsp. patula]